MEIIKRKISLDDYISKKEDTWGDLPITGFSINLFFTQDGDDMGIFTDNPLTQPNNRINTTNVDYTILIQKLNALGLRFNFMVGGTFSIPKNSDDVCTRHPDKTLSEYFKRGASISGLTSDRLEIVQSYDTSIPYKLNFDMEKGSYLNYENTTVDGVSRVIGITNNLIAIPTTNLNIINYVLDASLSDTLLGTPNQIHGIFLKTHSESPRVVQAADGTIIRIPKTEIFYRSQGFNITNGLLTPIFKEEYLFGITNTPEIQNDVFIDRGRNTILQRHLQMGDITNNAELVNYGNGFYKIIKN